MDLKRNLEIYIFVGLVINGNSYVILVDNEFKILPLVFIGACFFFFGAFCYDSLRRILNKTEEKLDDHILTIMHSMLGLSIVTWILTISAWVICILNKSGLTEKELYFSLFLLETMAILFYVSVIKKLKTDLKRESYELQTITENIK